MSGTLDEIINSLKKFKLEDVKRAVALLEEQKANKQSSVQPSAKISSSSKTEVTEANISDEMKAKALKVFNAADKDKSGTIDETELHALLIEMLGPISLPESNLIYKEMDTNHSGTITFDEFLVGLVKYSWDFSKIASREVLSYEWEVPFKELTLEKKLGEGIFGIVYKAKWRGATVACKRLKNPDMVEEINDFKREIAILAKLRHPNVVLFMGACTSDNNNMAIITEFLEGGNLHEAIHERNVRFEPKTNLSILRQTAFGLNYLHLSNIVHRDLKLANILVDKFNNCKLCDFGLSCVKPAQSDITDAVGSPLWRAPELLLKKPYNQSADVYSFALCSWELWSLEQPYLDIEDWDQLVKEVAIQGKRPTITSKIPSDLGSLLKQSWDQDPKKRPNMAQIIAQLERISNTQ